MQALIEGLMALVQRSMAGQERRPCEIRVDTSGAPPCVRALVDAMATTPYRVQLGELHLLPSHRIETLQGAFEAGQEGAELDDLDAYLAAAGPDGGRFDPAATLLLGADGGGMSALGLGWSDGRAYVALVEIADPTPDNLVRVFTTPAAFFDALDHINRRQPRLEDVEALRTAAGVAAPAAT